MDKETHKKLIKDFNKKDIRPAPKGKYGEYVPHHLYTKRLVEVIGGKYNFTFEEVRGKDNAIVGAKGRLEIEGLGVVEEVGDVSKYQLENNTESEVLKLAVSDSIKRCCMRFGLGLHLWVGESTEEEHYAEEEAKKVIKQLDNSSKEVVKETTKEDYLARITNELEHAEKDSELRNKYKLEAWNLFKQTHETNMGKWSSFELDKFLDLFYQVQAQDKNKEDTDKLTEDIVKDVFGDVEVGGDMTDIPSGKWEGEPPSEKQLKIFNDCVKKAIDNGDDELASKAKQALSSGKLTKSNIFDWIDTTTWSLKNN